jgi:nitroreductase
MIGRKTYVYIRLYNGFTMEVDMKRTTAFAVLVFGFVLPAMLVAQEAKSGVDIILNHYAARNFIPGAIPKTDLDRIVQAGVRAPSAGNGQPWLFTVVQTKSLLSKIMPNVADGAVIIVISGANADGSSRVVLDCALATESIYLAAQSLGYGSRIYTGRTVEGVNRNLKGELGIPSSNGVVAVVRIGRAAPDADAVSAASPRKPSNDVVSYK